MSEEEALELKETYEAVDCDVEPVDPNPFPVQVDKRLEDVLPALREGKMIRRHSWIDHSYIMLERRNPDTPHRGRLRHFNGSYTPHLSDWVGIGEDDIEADDWYVVQDLAKDAHADISRYYAHVGIVLDTTRCCELSR